MSGNDCAVPVTIYRYMIGTHLVSSSRFRCVLEDHIARNVGRRGSDEAHIVEDVMMSSTEREERVRAYYASDEALASITAYANGRLPASNPARLRHLKGECTCG